MKFALVFAALAVALTVPVASAAGPTLNGTVGPGFTITLTKAGKNVTTMKAGKVTIVVNDKGSIHNFHLTGPGVNKATSVSGTGKQTWNVTLKKGTYKYVCDVHTSVMHGSFKVT
jgi:plastocyanin